MDSAIEYTIAELVDAGVLERPIDGNHGEIHPKTGDFVSHGIPFIMASDLRAGQVDFSSCAFISKEQADSLRKGFAKAGDVLLSHKATIGRTAIVQPNPYPYLVLTPQVTYYRVKDREKLDNRYLRAYFNSAEFQAVFSAWAGAGSTRAYLGITAQLKLPIKLPPMHLQQAIADLYSPLGEKIELNRQTNETLEAMACALFRDWFVEFGPTRAKMEGREHYLASDLWSLFPNSIDDRTGLPEGWRAESLYDQADWINGAAYKNMHFSDAPDALPVIKIAELKAGITSQTKRTNTALGAKYLIDDNELLFSWSGNPDTSIDVFVWTNGPAWLNQHIFAVRQNGKRDNVFLYFMLKFFMSEFAEIARNKQTTGLGHVTKADMQRMTLCVADDAICQAFSEHAGPLFERMIVNMLESKTLATTRDYLLPKLMSGEVTVRDAEKSVSEAA